MLRNDIRVILVHEIWSRNSKILCRELVSGYLLAGLSTRNLSSIILVLCSEENLAPPVALVKTYPDFSTWKK